jgi:hypothetical protein
MGGEIQLNSTTMATESSGTITLSNVDSATNRTNLGLGSIATQAADSVAITGGSLTGTEIDLKSSGTTLYASDGSTSLMSESSGTVTVDNVTLGSNVSGVGQLIGTSYAEADSTAGNQVTLESSKTYHVIHSSYNTSLVTTFVEYTELSTDSSGNVTITARINLNNNDMVLESTGANLVRIKAPSITAFIENVAHIFEEGSTYDNA